MAIDKISKSVIGVVEDVKLNREDCQGKAASTLTSLSFRESAGRRMLAEISLTEYGNNAADATRNVHVNANAAPPGASVIILPSINNIKS